jgi:TfoX/Sxy family transcriptional regulator of competence genes
MQIPKPSEADKERFRSIVPGDPGVEIKPMFGNLGAFVHGNMFMGLFGADIGLKLAREDLDELARVAGSGSFGPAERPMGGYLTLPVALIGTPEAERWVRRALVFVAGLPARKGSR